VVGLGWIREFFEDEMEDRMRSQIEIGFNKRVGLTGVCLIALMVLLTVDHLSARTKALPIAAVANTSFSNDTTQRLQNSVHRLNAWLSGSKESGGWRRALLLNILDTQSALGEQANVMTLGEIHSRFNANTNGLDHPAFRDVRIALAAQIRHLSASRSGDLFASVTSARGQYVSISVEEMSRQRDQAKYELQILKKYYRQNMSSRKRANLFYELQLNQAIDHLDDVKFEVAPEISVGKMTSMIKGVEQDLDAVIQEIDAMPLTPEPDDEDETPTSDEDIEPLENADNVPPQPDDGEKSLQDLRKEQEKLEARIDELKEQRRAIAKEDKPRRDLRRKTFRELLAFESNFVDASQELGDPYFVSAAMSYERFVRTFFYGTQDNLQEDFLKRLEQLESDLLKLESAEARNAAGQVGDHLRWMENANQVPQLVTSIRARFSNPNLYVSISSRLLNQIASQSVSDATYLRENIDGRLVRGTLNTNANVNVELQDDPNQVHASIHLLGSLNSSTFIEQRKIRAYASSNGQLEGRRSVYANIGGLVASDAKVAANIQNLFGGTNSKFRIVNRIAAKKFEEVRAKSDGSTARKAEEQLLERFESQTDEPIENGMKALEDAQSRLIENTHLLPELYLRSFTSEVMAIGKKSSIATLAALDQPMTTPVRSDIAVRIHDSMLSNFLDRTFSGETFTDEQLASEIGSMFGQEPTALTSEPKPKKEGDKDEDEDDEEDESFTITFADVRPIQFEFENNGFRVVASGRSFAQGDKKINEGLKIILKYKIKRVDGKLKFVRDGKAEIEYLDEEKRATTVAFRSVLMGKLNPKEGVDQVSIDLPENLLPIDQFDALKEGEIANQLELVQCRAENGWLYLGWNHKPANTFVAWQYDTPAIWTEAVISKMQDPYLMEQSLDTGQSIISGAYPVELNAPIEQGGYQNQPAAPEGVSIFQNVPAQQSTPSQQGIPIYQNVEATPVQLTPVPIQR
jgi:hypothetical protein